LCVCVPPLYTGPPRYGFALPVFSMYHSRDENGLSS
jgi:hypothetical protein